MLLELKVTLLSFISLKASALISGEVNAEGCGGFLSLGWKPGWGEIMAVPHATSALKGIFKAGKSEMYIRPLHLEPPSYG